MGRYGHAERKADLECEMEETEVNGRKRLAEHALSILRNTTEPGFKLARLGTLFESEVMKGLKKK